MIGRLLDLSYISWRACLADLPADHNRGYSLRLRLRCHSQSMRLVPSCCRMAGAVPVWRASGNRRAYASVVSWQRTIKASQAGTRDLMAARASRRALSYHASPGEVGSVGGIRKLVDEPCKCPGWQCDARRGPGSPARRLPAQMRVTRRVAGRSGRDRDCTGIG